MSYQVEVLGVPAVVFAATNIDDIFLLVAFFARPDNLYRGDACIIGGLARLK